MKFPVIIYVKRGFAARFLDNSHVLYMQHSWQFDYLALLCHTSCGCLASRYFSYPAPVMSCGELSYFYYLILYTYSVPHLQPAFWVFSFFLRMWVVVFLLLMEFTSHTLSIGGANVALIGTGGLACAIPLTGMVLLKSRIALD